MKVVSVLFRRTVLLEGGCGLRNRAQLHLKLAEVADCASTQHFLKTGKPRHLLRHFLRLGLIGGTSANGARHTRPVREWNRL